MHANAWPLIEKHLKKRQKRQRDLAELLEVTPAAISQFKTGRILFNPAQLEKIIAFLQMDETACEELYAVLFSARLLPRQEISAESQQERPVPVGALELLRNYDSGLGAMDEYFSCRTDKRFPLLCARPGLCIATLSLRHHLFSALLLDTQSPPTPDHLLLGLTEERTFYLTRTGYGFNGACLDFGRLAVSSASEQAEKKFLWQCSVLALDIPLLY